jgi:DNA-binding transcriptional LysR family regulator
MQIQQVKYFLAACEELNFTRAAKRCNVAQPSLSAALQRLERELGGQLFVRVSTGVHLTELGRAVMPHFEQINRHIERARKIASAVRTANGMRRGRTDRRPAGLPNVRDRDRARERLGS